MRRLLLLPLVLFSGCGWHHAHPNADCAAHGGVRDVSKGTLETGGGSYQDWLVVCIDGTYIHDYEGEK
jgi:hypothetical protein